MHNPHPLNPRFLQAILAGSGALVLSAGWLHHLHLPFLFLPICSGLGTLLYYLSCTGKKLTLFKSFILVIFGTVIFYSGVSLASFSLFQMIILSTFLLMLAMYNTAVGSLRPLREIPFLKSILISSCWVFFILILPAWMLKRDVQLSAVELISFVPLFYALTIPADIVGASQDPVAMRTLPQLAGKKWASIISISMLLLFSSIQSVYFGNVLISVFAFLWGLILALACLVDQRPSVMVTMDALLVLLGLAYFV